MFNKAIFLLFLYITSVSNGVQDVSESFDSRKFYNYKIPPNTIKSITADICCNKPNMFKYEKNDPNGSNINLVIRLTPGDSIRAFNWKTKSFDDYTCENPKCWTSVHMFDTEPLAYELDGLYVKFYCGGLKGKKDLKSAGGAYIPIVVTTGLPTVDQASPNKPLLCNTNIANNGKKDSLSNEKKLVPKDNKKRNGERAKAPSDINYRDYAASPERENPM